jgi:hypothetical protein
MKMDSSRPWQCIADAEGLIAWWGEQATALGWTEREDPSAAVTRSKQRAAQKREHTMTNSSGYELRSSMDLMKEVSRNMGKVYQKESCFQPVYYVLSKNGVKYTVPSTDAMEAEQGNAERIKAQFERLGIVWSVRCCCSLRVFKDGRAYMPHLASVPEDAVPVLSFIMEDANGVTFMYRRVTETTKGKYRLGPLMIQHRLQHDPATTLLPRNDQATAH